MTDEVIGLSRAHNPSRSVDCSSESNVRGKAFRDKPFCVSAGVPAPSGVGSAQAFVDNDDTVHHGNNRWPSCATGDGSRHGPGHQAETIAAFYEFIRPKASYRNIVTRLKARRHYEASATATLAGSEDPIRGEIGSNPSTLVTG